MRAQIAKTIRKVVLDSGVLFDILLLNFARRPGVPAPQAGPWLSQLREPHRSSPDHRIRLLTLFREWPEVLTTSHVIGELQGLQSSRLGLREVVLTLFWDSSVDLLKGKGLNEELVRLLDIAREEGSAKRLGTLGPPDAGLMKLAFDKGATLITMDKPLAKRARELGVDGRLLWEVLCED